MNKALTHIQELVAKRRAKHQNKQIHFSFSKDDLELFNKLTTVQDITCDYNGKPYGELFIHWFYISRTQDTLTKCEIFHLNMMLYFSIPRKMSVIHIRLAYNGNYIPRPVNYLTDILKSYGCKIDLKIVKQKDNWEHDTIKEAVEYAITTDKYVYYTHFKGASRIKDSYTIKSGRETVHPLNVLYWCYIMYKGLFAEYPIHKAIGPISCNRVNKEYLLRDLSWSTNPKYQYIGSFQAFHGPSLLYAFNRLGLDSNKRNKLLWWGGRYTVEMFLTLVFLENEVYSIAQMEDECSAYNMYTKNFCPSIKTEFDNLFKVHTNVISDKNKVAICAIAKNEDLYLDEWVEHYLKLGASHIYIIDNNDNETEKLKELKANKNITIIPLYGEQKLKEIGYQVGAYQYVYNTYGSSYDWIGFFDIDEFVDIDNATIPEFLSNPIYKDTHIIHLHWRYYGDNGLTNYENKPIQERFKNPAPIDVKYANKNRNENEYVKSFVRTRYSEMQMDVHSPRFFGAVCRNSNGFFSLPTKTLEPIILDNARIKHYGTKTIEEYILRRMPNSDKSISPNGACPERKTITAIDRLNWFFNVNQVTEQKLRIIHDMLPNIKYVPAK